MSERVTIHHMRALGFCRTGIIAKAKLLGLDHRILWKEGMPISEIEHIDDGHIQAAIKKAREDGK